MCLSVSGIAAMNVTCSRMKCRSFFSMLAVMDLLLSSSTARLLCERSVISIDATARLRICRRSGKKSSVSNLL